MNRARLLLPIGLLVLSALACRPQPNTGATAGCGNGRLDAGESCDDGAANDDRTPGACRTDCRAAGCGDDTIDPGEACDDGTRNSDVRAGACRSDCALPRCGDGVIDPGEGCDDGPGNGAPPADCSATCAPAGCGDGRLDEGEECDDGAANRDDVADACRTTCRRAGCGDGVLDTGEACDRGRENSDWRPDACRATCRPAGCGDGALDTGEACDDGAANSDRTPDACRSGCRLPWCGDGVRDRDEGCDAGDGNSDTAPDTCRLGCRPPRCGDGVRDAGEGCDDGAANSDTVPGACRVGCVAAFCGDGVLDPGEECDPAGPPTPTCSACTVTAPATCFGRPELDLALEGLPDGTGGYRIRRNNAADPALVVTACGGNGPDTFFRYPVRTDGDLVIELEVEDGVGLDGLVEVLASCDTGNDVGCAPSVRDLEAVRQDRLLVLPDVHPSDGPKIIHVDSYTAVGGPYELYVHVAPPLGSGATCRLDGSLGRCDPQGGTLACLDDDGDGTGTCVAAGLANACGEDVGICGTGRDCLLDSSTGTCVPTCGNGQLDAGEECDDGNTTSGDGCTGCRSLGHSCATPFDLNAVWDAGRRVATWHADGTAFPPKWPDPCMADFSTRQAVARFTAPEAGTYWFDLQAEVGPPPSLGIADSCGAASPECGQWYPEGLDGKYAHADLDAGATVYVVAGFDTHEPSPTFTLTVSRGRCGDGALLQALEACDDGNTQAGDGCSPDCLFEGGWCAVPRQLVWAPLRAEASFTGTRFAYSSDRAGSCGGAGEPDVVFAFRAPFAGPWQMRVDPLWLGYPWPDGYPVVYVLAGTCGLAAPELACAVAPDWSQSATVTPVLAANQLVYVVVDGKLPDPTYGSGYPFELRVTPVACGDGIRTRYEACDDGNQASGDGCDSACASERREVEPNDLPTQASSLSLGFPVGGVLEGAGVDTYRFHAVGTARYTVDVSPELPFECDRYNGSFPRDLRFRLQDAAGHPLAGLENVGEGGCPVLALRAPATGDYLLTVERNTTDARPIPYWLELTTP